MLRSIDGPPSSRCRAFETEALAKVPEAARLQARGRTGFDDATVLRTAIVNLTRKVVRDATIEACAGDSIIFHEAKIGRMKLGEELQTDTAHALLIAFKEVNGSGAMMTAATATDAIRPIGIGLTGDRWRMRGQRTHASDNFRKQLR